MKQTPIDCVPCLLRQATEALQLCPSPQEGLETAVRELLLACTTLDFCQSPPVNAGTLQAQVRELTGVMDPYAEGKRRFNSLALELLPPLLAAVHASEDPFAAAVKLAIAGNVIDLGVKGGLTEAEASLVATQALEKPVLGKMEALREAVGKARDILYLCDNAGEIVFDRVLFDLLPADKLTVVVRGQAILNDATLADALIARISPVHRVIDNGSGYPGTVLRDCSPEFQRRFREADLIIAKGQGNFETLNDSDAPIFCLFRVKCGIVARYAGYPLGSHVVWSSESQPAAGGAG